MSSRGGNNGGALQSIPPSSRKMVQSLKEIVNCPEPEIYAMLKDCNMDPNEAVNRLLLQDPFHEVKSKREKRKETKDTTESRSRGVSGTSSRGSRGGTDRYVGRGGSTYFSSSETGAIHGKPAYKKENGANNYSSPSFPPSEVAGNNMNRRPASYSDPFTTENKTVTIGTVDGNLSLSHTSSGYHQPAWTGVPGQVSMADIVKMGRPHGKPSGTANQSQYGVSHHQVQASQTNALCHNLHSSEDYLSEVPELNHEPGVGTGQHDSWNDEWPLVEQPTAPIVPPVLEPPKASEPLTDASHLSSERANHYSQTLKDEARTVEDADSQIVNATQLGSGSVSSSKVPEVNTGGAAGASLFNSDIHNNISPYQPHENAAEHQEVEGIDVSGSSVTSNLQQLSVQEDQEPSPEEEGPSVIIPNHLQVQSADCSHLSFGSFGSGFSTGPFSSRPLQSNQQETSIDADVPSVGHSDTRNPEYYEDEPVGTASDGNLVQRSGTSAGGYETPSTSQPEVLKPENAEAPHESQYTFPSSSSNYNFENGQQFNPALPHSQSSSQMQNLAPFSNAYANSLPSSLLAASVQPVRESDLPYSPFPMSQSTSTKYGNTLPSLSSSISMPEALKAVGFSSTLPTAQTLPGSSIATGPALPQHLAVHPYSQPTLPLGPFANMIGYPFLPQSYTYMPSAFQQAFAGNNTYHQSLAAVLPQYKNSVSVTSLPQSAAIASGYGGFGSSTSVPGNFPMNPSAAPGATTLGYDDVLSSQYKDSNHLLSLQQSENSAAWVHGPGPRTMSGVQASTYYGLQGQNQQASGYRQSQQPSQNYGALGNPNFYHSHSGISLEHQQQNARDGSLVGSQGQPSKQSQQLWQNSY
ncbi:uncharacterized protein LOC127792879 isoform X2 [Diospyros lotus]|uniref:uncharacterized protein LOC127792879 isoform X2 n=1 Tax=Diospyros lotus TaxID=55363 RepID=UPI00224EC994|nr:uncharacterized protein LOC127792879 isoform X2 [Diospyros lotus]